MSTWDVIRFVLSAACTLAGLFVIITGVVGVFRFQYALSRMHAAALLDTLGIMLMLIGLMIAQNDPIAILKMLVVILFLWLTSPVTSHLLARMEVTVNDELEKSLNVLDADMVRHEKEGD